jgi:hypothetical protein
MNIKNIISNLTSPIDTEAGALINIPNSLIRLSIFMSLNAIFQAIADIVIEILILTEIVSFKIPLRVEFLFLTLISTVIAYLTLKGLREGNLDVTKNTLLIGLLVESSLVLGDIYLLFNTSSYFWVTLFIRLPFMIFTSSNIWIISRLIWKNISIKKARPNYKF